MTAMNGVLAKLEERLGLVFHDKALLEQAFTHRSYINENKKGDKGGEKKHNERLEFLGDAVLELVVTDYLYRTFPEKTEGELTAYRSSLVNSDMLGGVASELGFEECLLLSRGESKDKGRARTYILANTIEAFLGALYIDQGYGSAAAFISKHVTPKLSEIIEKKLWIDAKSLFQEKAQEHTGLTPSYKTIRESGPDHDKHFTVGLYIGPTQIVTGEGKSKQDAEQDAARKGVIEKGW